MFIFRSIGFGRLYLLVVFELIESLVCVQGRLFKNNLDFFSSPKTLLRLQRIKVLERAPTILSKRVNPLKDETKVGGSVFQINSLS